MTIGVNPRQNARLDSLRKSEVGLFGIPHESQPSANWLKVCELSKEFSRRTKESNGRGNKEVLAREIFQQLKSMTAGWLGTDQAPLMLLLDDVIYCAVAPDSMSPDERRTFLGLWRDRGFAPADIIASRGIRGQHWSYRLVQNFRNYESR